MSLRLRELRARQKELEAELVQVRAEMKRERALNARPRQKMDGGLGLRVMAMRDLQRSDAQIAASLKLPVAEVRRIYENFRLQEGLGPTRRT